MKVTNLATCISVELSSPISISSLLLEGFILWKILLATLRSFWVVETAVCLDIRTCYDRFVESSMMAVLLRQFLCKFLGFGESSLESGFCDVVV